MMLMADDLHWKKLTKGFNLYLVPKLWINKGLILKQLFSSSTLTTRMFQDSVSLFSHLVSHPSNNSIKWCVLIWILCFNLQKIQHIVCRVFFHVVIPAFVPIFDLSQPSFSQMFWKKQIGWDFLTNLFQLTLEYSSVIEEATVDSARVMKNTCWNHLSQTNYSSSQEHHFLLQEINMIHHVGLL